MDQTLSFVMTCEPKDVAMVNDIIEEHINRFAHKESARTYVWDA